MVDTEGPPLPRQCIVAPAPAQLMVAALPVDQQHPPPQPPSGTSIVVLSQSIALYASTDFYSVPPAQLTSSIDHMMLVSSFSRTNLHPCSPRPSSQCRYPSGLQPNASHHSPSQAHKHSSQRITLVTQPDPRHPCRLCLSPKGTASLGRLGDTQSHPVLHLLGAWLAFSACRVATNHCCSFVAADWPGSSEQDPDIMSWAKQLYHSPGSGNTNGVNLGCECLYCGYSWLGLSVLPLPSSRTDLLGTDTHVMLDKGGLQGHTPHSDALDARY
jgi:hypothetical protein